MMEGRKRGWTDNNRGPNSLFYPINISYAVVHAMMNHHHHHQHHHECHANGTHCTALIIKTPLHEGRTYTIELHGMVFGMIWHDMVYNSMTWCMERHEMLWCLVSHGMV